MPHGAAPAQLVSWGQPGAGLSRGMPLLKFNADGDSEAPLASSLLTELATQQQRACSPGAARSLAARPGAGSADTDRQWPPRRPVPHALPGMPTSSREQGAVPLDQQAMRPSPGWHTLPITGSAWVLLAGSIVPWPWRRSCWRSAWAHRPCKLSALLVALAGPAAALLLLQRSEPGHIGTSGDTFLVLADHRARTTWAAAAGYTTGPTS